MKKRPTYRLLSVFIALSFCFSGHSQNIDFIRNSGQYYYGIGSGANPNEARKNAFENLTESISVQIKSNFEQVVKETNENLDLYARSIVTTYSSARLRNYDSRVLKIEPGYEEIIVYVKKTDFHASFEEIELIINDLILSGNRALTDLRISDALRNYYWALVLGRSHPDNARLRHHFGSENEVSLLRGLEERLNGIFSQLRFEISSVTERDNPNRKQYQLAIFYNNQAVADIDYEYFMGDGQSGLMSARNGIGAATLDGKYAEEAENLIIRVQYQYANKAENEPVVNELYKNVLPMYFPRSVFSLSLQQRPAAATLSTPRSRISSIGQQGSDLRFYHSIVKQVVDAIQENNHSAIRSLFTSEGYEIYQKLIANGNVSILENNSETLSMISIGNETMLRAVPMVFAFRNNRERFVEDVIFTFNHENKISNLSFSLGDVAIQNILNKPAGFGSVEERFFLIKFMEDYKTAYSLKRHDYLQAIFDENALIIVGNVVRQASEPTEKVSGMYGNLSEEQVEYIWLSKSEYMERLSRVFNRNEFINIRFEDNTVYKPERDDKIYGIQIAQHYYSSTYADKGYLFLMIDLKDTLNPRIYVRTWQPRKNEDGSIFGLEDFRF